MSIIVYGPPGSGKTTLAEKLRKHYGCIGVIDDWIDGDPMPESYLILTQQYIGGAISIEKAKQAIGLDRN